MDSWAAIWASVRPPSDQGDQLPRGSHRGFQARMLVRNGRHELPSNEHLDVAGGRIL
jgi:hypothetical protein